MNVRFDYGLFGRRQPVPAWSAPLRLEVLEPREVFAVFNVDTDADTQDADLGDGLALDASNQTSLRAAVEQAAANGEADEIVLTAGTYELSAKLGALLLAGDLTIRTDGSGPVTIVGSGFDRVFEVLGGANVSMQDLLITGGNTSGSGGGILTHGTLSLERVTVYENSANLGGGIHVAAGGDLTMKNSTVSGNAADNGAGLAIDVGGTAHLIHVTVANNAGGSGVGGIFSADGGSATADTTLLNTIVAGNSGTFPDVHGVFVATGSDAGGNLIGSLDGVDAGTFAGDGNQVGDPGLQPLAAVGNTLVHVLAADSAAIDAASTAADDSAGLLSTDQVGTARPADGDEDTVFIADVGAYERRVVPPGGSLTPQIIGTVWFDEVTDGLRDLAEPRAAGITVRLLHDGNVIAQTVTNAFGFYSFMLDGTLFPGSPYGEIFTIEVDPVGNLFTLAGAGDENLDSDVNPGNGQAGPLIFGPLEILVRVDAGLVPGPPPGDGDGSGLDFTGPDFPPPPVQRVPIPNKPEADLLPLYTNPPVETFFRARVGERVAAYMHLYRIDDTAARPVIKRVLSLSMTSADPAEIQGLLGLLPKGKYRLTMEADRTEFQVWEGMLPLQNLIVRLGIDRILRTVQSQVAAQAALRELLPTVAAPPAVAGTSAESANSGTAAASAESGTAGASPDAPTGVRLDAAKLERLRQLFAPAPEAAVSDEAAPLRTSAKPAMP